jgi:hypothetical protein
MHVQHIESSLQRRTVGDERSAVVREGILMKHRTGTVSAIEYLKANEISGVVIQRVLAGSGLRSEDALALATLESADAV